MSEIRIEQNSIIQQLESLIASSMDVIFGISPTGKVVFTSKSSFDLLGYTPDEIIGGSVRQLIPLEKVNEYFKEVALLYRQDKIITFQAELLHKNGGRIPVEIRIKTVEVNGSQMGQGTIRDIRQKIETQRKLSSSENIFKAVWENTKDGMRLTDQDGIIVLCNNAFAELFSKTINELINKPISILYLEENKNNIIQRYRRNFIQGMVKDYSESSAVLWNGKKLFFEVSNSIIEDAAEKRFLLSILEILVKEKLTKN